jgi:hypothetical protein
MRAADHRGTARRAAVRSLLHGMRIEHPRVVNSLRGTPSGVLTCIEAVCVNRCFEAVRGVDLVLSVVRCAPCLWWVPRPSVGWACQGPCGARSLCDARQGGLLRRAGRGRMIRPPRGEGGCCGRGVCVGVGRLLGFVARGRSVGVGCGGGRQPALPMAFRHGHWVVPGDMMIDRVIPAPRGVRPLSLIRPSAAAGHPALARSDKDDPGAGRVSDPSR